MKLYIIFDSSKQDIMQEAYIVAGYRTAVGKSKKGGFRFFRPDDLAIEVIKGLMASSLMSWPRPGRWGTIR